MQSIRSFFSKVAPSFRVHPVTEILLRLSQEKDQHIRTLSNVPRYTLTFSRAINVRTRR